MAQTRSARLDDLYTHSRKQNARNTNLDVTYAIDVIIYVEHLCMTTLRQGFFDGRCFTKTVATALSLDLCVKPSNKDRHTRIIREPCPH